MVPAGGHAAATPTTSGHVECGGRPARPPPGGGGGRPSSPRMPPPGGRSAECTSRGIRDIGFASSTTHIPFSSTSVMRMGTAGPRSRSTGPRGSGQWRRTHGRPRPLAAPTTRSMASARSDRRVRHRLLAVVTGVTGFVHRVVKRAGDRVVPVDLEPRRRSASWTRSSPNRRPTRPAGWRSLTAAVARSAPAAALPPRPRQCGAGPHRPPRPAAGVRVSDPRRHDRAPPCLPPSPRSPPPRRHSRRNRRGQHIRQRPRLGHDQRQEATSLPQRTCGTGHGGAQWWRSLLSE